MCPYDSDNCAHAGAALMNKCSKSLRDAIEASIPEPDDWIGPLVLYKILHHVQSSDSALVRSLCEQLQALSIASVPGEDMQTFSLKIQAMLDQITSASDVGEEPKDLVVLIAKTVQTSSDPELKMLSTRIITDKEYRLNKTPTPALALKVLNEKYMALLHNKCYKPALAKGNDQPAAFQAVQSQVKTLVKQVNKMQQQSSANKDSKSTGNSNGGSNKSNRDKSNDTCTSCGGKGHWANDKECPNYEKREQARKDKQKQNQDLSDKDKKILELIKKTKVPDDANDDTYLELKLDGEVVAKYCHKCKRFKSGKAMHSTSEHRAKKSKDQANLAASPAPSTGTSPVFTPPTGLFSLMGENYDTPLLDSPRSPSANHAFERCLSTGWWLKDNGGRGS